MAAAWGPSRPAIPPLFVPGTSVIDFAPQNVMLGHKVDFGDGVAHETHGIDGVVPDLGRERQ